MAGERRRLLAQERAAGRALPAPEPWPVTEPDGGTPDAGTPDAGTPVRRAARRGPRPEGRRVPRWVVGVALAEAVAAVLMLTDHLPTPLEARTFGAPARGAAAGGQAATALRASATQALATGSARFRYSVSWRDDDNFDVLLSGTGRVDLRAGRLDYETWATGSAGGWHNRTTLIGTRAYVGQLGGTDKGKWYTRTLKEAAADEITYTQDGFLDPLEYLRLLSEVGWDARAVGRRTVEGREATAYVASVKPSVRVAKAMSGPGRKPGALARSLKEDRVRRADLRVYLDAQGLPVRIDLESRAATTDHQRSQVTMTLAGWGAPQAIAKPKGKVYGYDAYISCIAGTGPC